MPEHIRALIVILFLSTLVFTFAKKPACEIIRFSDFARRRNLWIVLTLTAFLTHNIWIYLLIASVLMFFARARDPSPVALFFFLVFLLPVFQVQVPGMGLVNYLFTLSHQRLLTLVILLPAYIALIGQKQPLPFGRTIPDKLLAAYIILIIVLYFRETTLTDTLRQGFNQFIDIFLPYYVISRLLKSVQDFREALLCFVIATMILAAIGIFEAAKHWLLYSSLINSLDLGGALSSYLGRGGILRAIASTGQPIALGYVMAVAFGFYLYLQQSITSNFSRRMGLLLLCAGLLAPLSRGPWVGVICIIAVFIAIGNRPARQLSTLLLVGIIAIPLISIMPGSEKIINLIPFIGETEKVNIDYRSRLFKSAMIVVERNPWFGSVDYLKTPEMESMRQGQGIIDIVNTYIGIALEIGFIGVSLFIGFFLTIGWGIYQNLRSMPNKRSEEHLLGRALLATLTGILIIIATVSSISIISIVYWSVAGLGAAYISMIKQLRNSQVGSDNHHV